MAYKVADTAVKYEGDIVRVRTDTVVQPDGARADREVVEHAGSVATVAVDGQQRVLLIRQYRHPAGQYLWELPVGLRDQPWETALDTARRELAEQAGWTAEDWDTLVDLYPSPGISTEMCRIYQAGRLRRGERPVRPEDEGSSLHVRWFPLAKAVHAVLAGHIINGLAVAGLLATGVRHGLLERRIRPADTPWRGG
jgi:ADP-ribose pyrophosphatase